MSKTTPFFNLKKRWFRKKPSIRLSSHFLRNHQKKNFGNKKIAILATRSNVNPCGYTLSYHDHIFYSKIKKIGENKRYSKIKKFWTISINRDNPFKILEQMLIQKGLKIIDLTKLIKILFLILIGYHLLVTISQAIKK
jgi:hypothetical protein